MYVFTTDVSQRPVIGTAQFKMYVFNLEIFHRDMSVKLYTAELVSTASKIKFENNKKFNNNMWNNIDIN